MKNKTKTKILHTLLVAITTFFAVATNVYAEVPSQIEISSSAAVKRYIGENTNFGTKTLADKTLAYCLDYHKQTTQNTTATLVGEMDAGIVYLIESGQNITGDQEKDYFITQTAIWWYLDDTTGSKNLDEAFKTTDSDPENLRPYIQKLVENAKIAKKNGYPNPQISTIINRDLTISEDKKYYLSEEIKVNLVDADTYTVSLKNAPAGSSIRDQAGNIKTTFGKNETFRVYIPATITEEEKQNIKVSVSTTTTYNKVYEYAPPTTEEQNLVPAILYPTTVTKDAELLLTVKDYPEVIVPNTNSNSTMMYILGTLIILSTMGFVIYNGKAKQN